MKVKSLVKPYILAFNFTQIDMNKSLGVKRVALRLSKALREYVKTVCFFKEDDYTRNNIAFKKILHESFDKILNIKELNALKDNAFTIEILPHHFTRPLLNSTVVNLVHDLHIFDISWKYKNFETQLKNFKENLRKSHSVITHFPRTYFDLEKISGVNINNIYLIDSPLMIDDNNTEDLNISSIYNLEDKSYILYPSQFQPHKGHIQLIKAYKDLKSKTFKLVLIGSEDVESETKKKVKNLINQLGLNEKVLILGHVNEESLISLYKNSCGVIIPSLAEGGAYVAMEAISYSLPVALNKIRQASMHLSQINAQVKWFDTNKKQSLIEALNYFSDQKQIDFDVMVNVHACKKIKNLSWQSVAKKLIKIFDYHSGLRPRPICKIDSNLNPRW